MNARLPIITTALATLLIAGCQTGSDPSLSEASNRSAAAVIKQVRDFVQQAAPTPEQAEKYKVPELKANQIWVSSLPPGLNVYLMKRDILVSRPDDSGRETIWMTVFLEEDRGLYHTVCVGNLDSERYLVGKTPLIVNIEPQAVVVITGDIQKLTKQLKGDYSGILRREVFQDPTFDGLAMIFTVKGDDPIPKEVGVIYDVTKTERNVYVCSLLPVGIKIDQVGRYYPPGVNFDFPDEIIRIVLADSGLENRYISTAIELIHRGGKVCYVRGNKRYVAEFTNRTLDGFHVVSSSPSP